MRCTEPHVRAGRLRQRLQGGRQGRQLSIAPRRGQGLWQGRRCSQRLASAQQPQAAGRLAARQAEETGLGARAGRGFGRGRGADFGPTRVCGGSGHLQAPVRGRTGLQADQRGGARCACLHTQPQPTGHCSSPPAEAGPAVRQVPQFNAFMFLENKTQIGKVDEIFGSIKDVVRAAGRPLHVGRGTSPGGSHSRACAQFFTIKPQDGIVATSYSPGDKFYIDPGRLLSLQRFLPQPKGSAPSGAAPDQPQPRPCNCAGLRSPVHAPPTSSGVLSRPAPVRPAAPAGCCRPAARPPQARVVCQPVSSMVSPGGRGRGPGVRGGGSPGRTRRPLQQGRPGRRQLQGLPQRRGRLQGGARRRWLQGQGPIARGWAASPPVPGVTRPG